MSQNPSLETHVAETAELPGEDHGQLVGRADLPTPSLLQARVKVKHRVTKQEAVIFRVDHGMNMLRLYYPAEDRLANRTEWEQARNWEPELTFSPAELERQAAAAKLEAEIASLDARSIGLARVLCDDPDPNKALAKLGLLVQSGMLTPMSVDVAAKVLADIPDPPLVEKPKRAPKAEPKS